MLPYVKFLFLIIMTDTDMIIISQDEIDYIINCMRYLDSYTVNREELAERIMSLPAGRKRLQKWGDD